MKNINSLVKIEEQLNKAFNKATLYNDEIAKAKNINEVEEIINRYYEGYKIDDITFLN
jgi:hypothetical protein